MVKGDCRKRGPGMPSGLAGSSPAAATGGLPVRRAMSSSVDARAARHRRRRTAPARPRPGRSRPAAGGPRGQRTSPGRRVHGSMPPWLLKRPSSRRPRARNPRWTTRAPSTGRCSPRRPSSRRARPPRWTRTRRSCWRPSSSPPSVFWLMHVYVRVIGSEMAQHVSVRTAVRRSALKELPILIAVVPPALAVVVAIVHRRAGRPGRLGGVVGRPRRSGGLDLAGAAPGARATQRRGPLAARQPGARARPRRAEGRHQPLSEPVPDRQLRRPGSG